MRYVMTRCTVVFLVVQLLSGCGRGVKQIGAFAIGADSFEDVTTPVILAVGSGVYLGASSSHEHFVPIPIPGEDGFEPTQVKDLRIDLGGSTVLSSVNAAEHRYSVQSPGRVTVTVTGKVAGDTSSASVDLEAVNVARTTLELLTQPATTPRLVGERVLVRASFFDDQDRRLAAPGIHPDGLPPGAQFDSSGTSRYQFEFRASVPEFVIGGVTTPVVAEPDGVGNVVQKSARGTEVRVGPMLKGRQLRYMDVTYSVNGQVLTPKVCTASLDLDLSGKPTTIDRDTFPIRRVENASDGPCRIEVTVTTGPSVLTEVIELSSDQL